jgi:uncharacterized protein
MGRLVVIVLIVVLVVWLLKRALAGPRKPPEGASPAAGPHAELVDCAHCGVKLPKAEAYAASGVLPGAGGRHYCSEEHWRAGPRDG